MLCPSTAMGKQLVTLISVLRWLLCQVSHCPGAIAEELLPRTEWERAAPPVPPASAQEVGSSPALARGAFSAQELILNVSLPASRPRFSADSVPRDCAVYFFICCDSRNTLPAPKLEQGLSFSCPHQLFHAELNFCVSRYSRSLVFASIQCFGSPKP